MSTDIFRICGIALICTIAVFIVRQYKPEMSIPVRIIGGIIMLSMLLQSAEPVLTYARDLMEAGGMLSYGEIALRALGITLLTHICACICRDCGENTLANITESAGKIGTLLLCLPLFREITEYVAALLG